MNDLVKKPNKKTPYSMKALEALDNSQSDPMYFIENFVKIQHPKIGSVDFQPYDYQKKIINAFHTHSKCVVLTGRQLGKTTVASAYILWRAMFVEDSKILIVGNKMKAAMEVMDRIKYAYEECPDFIKAGVLEYNKSTLTFDNGSKIEAVATTPDAGRGRSISLLYCLSGNSMVTVRNKITGDISNVSLSELYDIVG